VRLCQRRRICRTVGFCRRRQGALAAASSGKNRRVAFNYRSQLREMGLPIEPLEQAAFFVRPAANALVGPGEPVYMPQGDGLDWEIEIGVVMGRRMRHVSAQEGLRGVAAYAVTVDMTVRDLVAVSAAFKTDLFRGKCQDGLSPIGPILTPSVFVQEPQRLRLRLSVNGEMKQDETSSDMLRPIGELISEASRYITWERVIFSSPEHLPAPAESRGDFCVPGTGCTRKSKH